MNYTKLKFAFSLGAAVLLASGAVTVAHSQTDGGKLTVQEIVNKVKDKYASLSSYGDSGKTTVEMGGMKISTIFNIRLERSGFYRIEWTQTAVGNTVKGAAWFAGDGDFLQIQGQGFSKYSKMQTRQVALTAAGPLSGMVAQIIPALFFNDSASNVLSTSLTEQGEEAIGDTDCYVLTGNMAPYKMTFWIGQTDFLIHQIRRDADSGAADVSISDSSIEETLRKLNKPVTPEAVAKMRSDMEELQKRAQKLQQQHSIKSIISMETHEHISLNKSMSKADFVHEVPKGLKPSSSF